MKTQTQTIILKAVTCFLLLIFILPSCKKDKGTEITPTLELKATVDGKSYTVDAGKLSVNSYSDSGDPKKALEVTAPLDNNGTQLVFFSNDLKDGIINILPKVGSSLNPKKPQTPTVTDVVDQSYVKFISGGNNFYAFSGSITIKIVNNILTYSWNITFKDATSREFNSTGSMIIDLSKYTAKPKSEIKDPTPLSAKPTLESIAPNIGPDGTEVTISGTNFSTTLTDNVVKFNGLEAVVKSATATKLVVTSPKYGTTGAVSVKVKNSEIATGPVFTAQALPTILSVSPAIGKVGDAVTILGTNFSSVLAENVVKFNGTTATITSVIVGGMQLTVPVGATTGPVSISVKGGATVTGPQFQVSTANTGGSGTVDYITKLDGTAGFTKIATATSKITEMFIDKSSKTLYYSTFDKLAPSPTNTVYKLSLTGGDPVKFSADARVTNISYITTDAQGNVFMLYNQDNSAQKVTILKSTPDGVTVTEVAKDISYQGNTTKRLYVDSQDTIWLGHSNKIVNGVDTYVSSHNANGAYDGPLFKGDQAYLVDFKQYGNISFKTLNLVTGTNAPTDFNLLGMFKQDDAKIDDNNYLGKYSILAVDGDESAYILYPLSYQTGQLTLTWIIRKTKNGAAGASTLMAKFITKYSSSPYYAEPQGQANEAPVFVAGPSGDVYMRYNDKDIIKISQ
jgi:hypothetical protein